MAHRCLVCGQTLDATDALFARLTTRTPDQLRRLRKTGAEIKAEQESASKARLKEMWADEARRREEQAIARAERERQERLIIALAVALVVVAVVVAIVMTAGF
jgi:Flp pilus assembly protein TadB